MPLVQFQVSSLRLHKNKKRKVKYNIDSVRGQ
nr:MAG TPA: hypothetical protein [Caudoviricetes sp.]